MPKDEVELKNVKKEEDIQFVMSLTKTISGAFVNSNDVPTQELPGNFGVRVIGTMPTNMRTVFVDQRSNMELGFACDNRPSLIPYILDKPDTNDYLTDEESDDAADFEVKVPELDSLLTQFEADDTTIHQLNEESKSQVKDLVARGFEPEPRHSIMNKKGNQAQLLDTNISKQREKQVTLLPGMISDLNEMIKKPQNKLYLR
jgi:hypothetical protein